MPKKEFEGHYLALTDEEDVGSDTAEVTYYNDTMKRRSTQPCSKKTLPTIQGSITTRSII